MNPYGPRFLMSAALVGLIVLAPGILVIRSDGIAAAIEPDNPHIGPGGRLGDGGFALWTTPAQATDTATATGTSTPPATATATASSTATATDTPTTTQTPEPTDSPTSTATATAGATESPTATVTPTATPSASETRTATLTPTTTPTPSPSPTPTATVEVMDHRLYLAMILKAVLASPEKAARLETGQSVSVRDRVEADPG